MSAPLRRVRAGRVLMTTDAVGGVWTYSLDLARGLAARGVETLLVVLGPTPSADQLAEAADMPGVSLVDTGLALDWTASEAADVLEAGAAIRGLARGSGVDLIHLNSPALAAEGRFSAPVVGACHSCLATWWDAVRDGPLPEDFRWRTRLLWRGLMACDTLLAPTQAFADATRRTYESPPPHVVWNGRRPAAAAPAQACRPVVLTSGRLWDDAKNMAVLDAAAGLCGVPVLMAGPLEGPQGQRLRLHHAEALGRLTAPRMAEQLATAPVYASAALYEPFGLGVLEAAQAGCALVLSDIPTFRELWDGAAEFAPADDPAAFARAFDRLAADPAACAALAAAARMRSRRYTADAMADATLALYAEVQPKFSRALAPEVAA